MKKMLLYESLYLTLPSIVISIILGTVLGYLTVSFMGVSQATMTYQLPLWIVGIYTISMIVMPLCLSYYLSPRLDTLYLKIISGFLNNLNLSNLHITSMNKFKSSLLNLLSSSKVCAIQY